MQKDHEVLFRLSNQVAEEMFTKEDNYDGNAAMSEVAKRASDKLQEIEKIVNKDGRILCNPETKKILLEIIQHSLLYMLLYGSQASILAMEYVYKKQHLRGNKAIQRIKNILQNVEKEMKGKTLLNVDIMEIAAKQYVEHITKYGELIKNRRKNKTS